MTCGEIRVRMLRDNFAQLWRSKRRFINTLNCGATARSCEAKLALRVVTPQSVRKRSHGAIKNPGENPVFKRKWLHEGKLRCLHLLKPRFQKCSVRCEQSRFLKQEFGEHTIMVWLNYCGDENICVHFCTLVSTMPDKHRWYWRKSVLTSLIVYEKATTCFPHLRVRWLLL